MRNNWLLPAAIILAGLMVAIAIYMVRSANENVIESVDVSAIRPVSPEEHIVGNPKAPVIVVEYSDVDCAYCKQFQRTMSQIMVDYGADGKVAWVYRHFPLVQSHPNAGKHAEAAECVASLAGNEAFFRFIDLMHSTTPGAEEFDPSTYTALLPQVNVPVDAFTACMSEGRFVSKVEDDLKNALAIGANAAPHSVILIEGAEPIELSGALPYAAMTEVIDRALRDAVPQ